MTVHLEEQEAGVDQEVGSTLLFGRPCGDRVAWAREQREEREEAVSARGGDPVEEDPWTEADMLDLEDAMEAFLLGTGPSGTRAPGARDAQSGTSTNRKHPSERAFAKAIALGHTPEQALRSLTRRHRRGTLPALPEFDVQLPASCDDTDAQIVKVCRERVLVRMAAGKGSSTPFTQGVGTELTGVPWGTFWRRWRRLVALGVIVEDGSIATGGRSCRLWRLAAMDDEIVQKLTRELAEAAVAAELAAERAWLASMAPLLKAPAVTVLAPSRACVRCGGAMTTRAVQARYCSDGCKQAAYRERREAIASQTQVGTAWAEEDEGERLLRFLHICFPDVMLVPDNRDLLQAAVASDAQGVRRLIDELGVRGALRRLRTAPVRT